MTAIPFAAAGKAAAAVRRRPRRRATKGMVARMLAWLRAWRRRAKDRSALAALDDRMLADIGISRAEAEFLANKPFWRM